LEVVEIDGKKRKYYAPKDFLSRKFPDFDDRMRIIAPLDPIVWDRDLVEHVFEFNYVWEVYKKVHQRKWGYYVCPLLYKGEFVGRIEGKIILLPQIFIFKGEIKDDVLVIMRIWREKKAVEDWNEESLMEALERHAKCCGLSSLTLPNPKYADLEEEVTGKRKKEQKTKKEKDVKKAKKTKSKS
jgi:uncharacterized protein YcaQ